jgi:hypothetical protein
VSKDGGTTEGCFELLEGRKSLIRDREFGLVFFLKEVGKRKGDLGVISNESSIVVSKSQEDLKFMNVTRRFSFLDSFHFDLIHFYTLWPNNKHQIFNCIYTKVALLRLGKKIIFSKLLKHFLDMFLVLFFIL